MIDLTFVSSGLLKDNTCWRVSDTCTLTDHCAIAWRVAQQREREGQRTNHQRKTSSPAGKQASSTLMPCVSVWRVTTPRDHQPKKKLKTSCERWQMPAMPPCQGKEKETRTSLSTGGTTKSRRSVRSATKQGTGDGQHPQRGAEDGNKGSSRDIPGYIQYLPCRGNFPRAMEAAKTGALA